MRCLLQSLFLLTVAGAPLLGCQQQKRTASPEAPSQQAPSEAPGRLVDAGAMASARVAHSATALLDGRVLIAGGAGDASAELFDAASGAFEATGSMRTPRQSHTATRLADGTVLLTGGYGPGNAYLASAEIYDPARGTFEEAGAMTTARAGHVATTLDDGRVLLVGGVGTGWTFLASAEIYDPETGAFTPTGSMQLPRESHVSVRLPDGRVLILGGHSGRRSDIRLYTSIEVYDPATGTFRAAGDMAVRRHKHDAVLLPDGRVLITGGTDERDYDGRYDSAEIYDPATAASGEIRAMQLERYKHAGTSVALPDGTFLIAGGAPEAEVFDPEAQAFARVQGEARMVGQFSAAAPLPDGGVLVTGGYGEGRGAQAGAWRYRP